MGSESTGLRLTGPTPEAACCSLLKRPRFLRGVKVSAAPRGGSPSEVRALQGTGQGETLSLGRGPGSAVRSLHLLQTGPPLTPHEKWVRGAKGLVRVTWKLKARSSSHYTDPPAPDSFSLTLPAL